MMQRHTSHTLRTWGWPVVVGVLTTIGLVAGLFSDGGPGDMLANACLAVPAVLSLWLGWGRRRH